MNNKKRKKMAQIVGIITLAILVLGMFTPVLSNFISQ